LVLLDGEAVEDPLLALLRDEVDAVIGSWLVRVEPQRAASLRRDPRFEVVDGPGSSVTWLAFRLEGATADVAVRRAVAAAIDRQDLVRRVEHGFADPCTAWAAPSVRVWPRSGA